MATARATSLSFKDVFSGILWELMHVTNRPLVDAKLPIAGQLLHFLSLDDYQKGEASCFSSSPPQADWFC